MKSRVHPKYKTKYRVRNWPQHERAVVQRGDVTLRLSAAAIATWRPAPSGQPGGQVAEAGVACRVSNQMTSLGRPDSYAIGR